MTIAYFDCASGISGDMFLGALVDAGLPVERLSAAVEALGIPGLKLAAAKVTRLGIAATKVDVVAPPEHAHRHLADVERLIDSSGLSAPVKATAKRVFARLAAAEAKVHNAPVDEVHFHEIGAADSIADIVGAAAGLELLGVEKCFFSAIPTGSGTVKMAHGTVPVPAPATAELLVGVPLAGTSETGELTTPTGAALARELSAGFSPLPAMTVSSVGCGAGSREGVSMPNVLRVFLGRPSADATPRSVTVIEAAIDDMTGEALSFARDAIFAAGALDAYFTPIFMKKGRPAYLLTVLADEAGKPAVLEALFRETTTFGARVSTSLRETLDRRVLELESELGAFRVKVGSYNGRVVSAAPEYEDVKRIAAEKALPFRQVYAALQSEALRRAATAGAKEAPRKPGGSADAR